MPDTDPGGREAAAKWTGVILLLCFIATFTGVVCGLDSLLLWSCEIKWAAGCATASSKTALLPICPHSLVCDITWFYSSGRSNTGAHLAYAPSLLLG